MTETTKFISLGAELYKLVAVLSEVFKDHPDVGHKIGFESKLDGCMAVQVYPDANCGRGLETSYFYKEEPSQWLLTFETFMSDIGYLITPIEFLEKDSCRNRIQLILNMVKN